jgi:hypothetical protein
MGLEQSKSYSPYGYDGIVVNEDNQELPLYQGVKLTTSVTPLPINSNFRFFPERTILFHDYIKTMKISVPISNAESADATLAQAQVIVNTADETKTCATWAFTLNSSVAYETDTTNTGANEILTGFEIITKEYPEGIRTGFSNVQVGSRPHELKFESELGFIGYIEENDHKGLIGLISYDNTLCFFTNHGPSYSLKRFPLGMRLASLQIIRTIHPEIDNFGQATVELISIDSKGLIERYESRQINVLAVNYTFDNSTPTPDSVITQLTFLHIDRSDFIVRASVSKPYQEIFSSHPNTDTSTDTNTNVATDDEPKMSYLDFQAFLVLIGLLFAVGFLSLSHRLNTTPHDSDSDDDVQS